MMQTTRVAGLALAAAATALIAMSGVSDASARTLKASHQWPGGKGDLRDEMVQIIAREVAAANVGIDVRVYPGAQLFKPREQWNAMVKGVLDISAFPLDYASGQHPQFSATLMPGLVKNHEHALRLNDSPFMDDIEAIINEAGVVVLADTWLAGGFVGKEHCIVAPDDASGQTMRAAGPAFEQMLVGAGASIASMPSSEIYTALQTGVLDGANTSSGSFLSYRIYEQVACLTPPGDYALWFMYEPILMSKRTWDSLSEEQQAAFQSAGEKAEYYAYEAAKEVDGKMVSAFENAGVEIAHMDADQFKAWLAIADKTSYAAFSSQVEGGRALLDKALAVE
ncbi:ABC transporter substrate-binding protein [Roseospira marina]|uniref:ABC transporter substrate-binding protein n=1 Tax=Roseospira marina TaxID=140057 RepID=A0A5M6ICL9_9PROT|nr:TRAP transporter substrate-binding protein DctP [Roseospira marina]KAA5605872.1 ABC transporter substrate-binding protein [Roseospira marina]MBB4313692.1 TRAP-type C4-dicarboxylate transport system substrate-binding protein [Roseospira marina]MBB5086854.1 TRAP-type C4-dicarboxylate transport system substrate-binding protein [Roseospira marina]